MTEGGVFEALTKYTGNHSEYHDWSFSARRVFTRADERLAGLLQWISGQIDEFEVIWAADFSSILSDLGTTTDRRGRNCARVAERKQNTYDGPQLNSELYARSTIKTSDTAMASIESLDEVEVKGIIGWQRLEREARGYHRHCVALLIESVTHQERMLKVFDVPQACYRWESSLK